MKPELRKSSRIHLESLIRFVPSDNRKSELLKGQCVNFSDRGLSLLFSSLPPANKHIEVYFPIDQDKLLPVLAEQVWLTVNEDLNSKDDHWVKAGYKLYFRNDEDRSTFDTIYKKQGGHTQIRADQKRVSFVF